MGPREETGPSWRNGAMQSNQSKMRSAVQKAPWKHTDVHSCENAKTCNSLFDIVSCDEVKDCEMYCMHLLTLRLSVACCASMRLMASA